MTFVCRETLSPSVMLGSVITLNEVYSSLSTRRRYEVFFIRLGLADGNGAWWFRYLLMNPGRNGCPEHAAGKPVQVWATWFPAAGVPQTFIQGFSLAQFQLSPRGQSPVHFAVADNVLDENSCRGRLQVDGHEVSWDLNYHSTFRVTLSSKGWIGFSRTPHSDAVFSGHIELDGRRFAGDPLGFGLQGHNCGYRHRTFWTWTHAYFPRPAGNPSTLEALVYDMPLGLVFRKAVLWHEGKAYVFRKLRVTQKNQADLQWTFDAAGQDGSHLEAAIDGRGRATHRLPYMKTDCFGSFEVANNSLANAVVRFQRPGGPAERLETTGGVVLEMGGQGHSLE